MIGPTATGKSFCLNDYLAKKLDKNVFVSINMIFSAGTEANQVQTNIMERLNKRRKGVYGPSLGKKCVIFVDDLSLPRSKTNDKSQSAIELLRMLVEHSLWYDLKRLDPIKMIDLQVGGYPMATYARFDRKHWNFPDHVCNDHAVCS